MTDKNKKYFLRDHFRKRYFEVYGEYLSNKMLRELKNKRYERIMEFICKLSNTKLFYAMSSKGIRCHYVYSSKYKEFVTIYPVKHGKKKFEGKYKQSIKKNKTLIWWED